MSTGFELSAQIRSTSGKASARRMRRENQVPGIIYGAGKAPEMITLVHDHILHALENEAFHSHILSITLNGQAESVVLKGVQRHVFKPKIEHVDFLRVKANEKLTMHIPVHYVGEEESPGIKAEGVLSKLVTDVEIRCLPKDLPEFIEVSIAHLGLDESLHLSDVVLPQGVEWARELDEDHNQTIVSIHEARLAQDEEEVAAAEAEETTADDATPDASESADEAGTSESN